MALRTGVSGWAPRPAAYAYDSIYRSGDANWDIGRPQEAFVALEEAGVVGQRVLDVGTGTGELALYLARRGHDVLGIDFSPTAVQEATARAHGRRIPARFLVWDALRLDELRMRFDTVTDSAMYHTLGEPDRERFTSVLADVLRPGGRLLLFCDVRPNDRPVWEGGASEAELRERFAGPEWDLEWLHRTTFQRRHSTNPAYIVSVRRTEAQA